MKLNAVRSMLIASIIIILLYILGLFIPINKNTKESNIFENKTIQYVNLKIKSNYF